MTTAFWREFWSNPARRGTPYYGNAPGQHRAQDVSASGGVLDIPILRGGTVALTGYQSEVGSWFSVDVGGGRFDIYCHVYRDTRPPAGSSLHTGQVAARMARSNEDPGSAWTGPHIHFVISNDARGATREYASFNPVPTIDAQLANPVPVSNDWSFALTPSRVLQGKSGLYAGVETLRENVAAVASDGNSVAAVDTAGSVWVRQGGWGAGWVGLASNAANVAIDGDRFVVLHRDGTVTAKDGLYSTEWTTQIAGASMIAASDNRIGVLVGGTLHVKEGNLWSGWTNQASGVTSFDLDGNRIGIVGNGAQASVKEGTLWSSWVPMASAEQIRLAPNRVGLLRGGMLNVKEGNLYEAWRQLATGVNQFEMSGARIGITQGGSGRLLSGALDSGFVGAYGNTASIHLS